MMLADRRLVELVAESRYGEDPGTPGLFPAYLQGDQWATRTREVETRTPSQAGWGQQEERAGVIRGAFEPLRTVLYDQGPALMDWTVLLEAAGLARRSADTWEVGEGVRRSLTLRDYRDGVRRRLTGCVATLTLRAEAGEAVDIDATLAGRAEDDIAATVPSGALDLPEPPKACEAGLTISVDGWGAIAPVADQLQLDTGTVILTKRPSREGAAALEYRVGDCLPTVRCTIEAVRDLDWEACRGRRVEIGWGIGQVARWEFELPRLQLVGDPEITRLPSGGEGVTLLFRSREGRGTPLRVRRTIP